MAELARSLAVLVQTQPHVRVRMGHVQGIQIALLPGLNATNIRTIVSIKKNLLEQRNVVALVKLTYLAGLEICLLQSPSHLRKWHNFVSVFYLKVQF
jgi:hypothetical protein